MVNIYTQRKFIFPVEIMSAENHNLKVCCFCGLTEDNELEFGKFHEYHGIITHYYCMVNI